MASIPATHNEVCVRDPQQIVPEAALDLGKAGCGNSFIFSTGAHEFAAIVVQNPARDPRLLWDIAPVIGDETASRTQSQPAKLNKSAGFSIVQMVNYTRS